MPIEIVILLDNAINNAITMRELEIGRGNGS